MSEAFEQTRRKYETAELKRLYAENEILRANIDALVSELEENARYSDEYPEDAKLMRRAAGVLKALMMRVTELAIALKEARP